MKYVCTLIAVKDIELSKKFYHDILGQDVIVDLGANVTLTGGFSLQIEIYLLYFLQIINSNLSQIQLIRTSR